MICINIFHNRKNIKKYINALDKIFKDISKKISKKFLNLKYALTPLIE